MPCPAIDLTLNSPEIETELSDNCYDALRPRHRICQGQFMDVLGPLDTCTEVRTIKRETLDALIVRNDARIIRAASIRWDHSVSNLTDVPHVQKCRSRLSQIHFPDVVVFITHVDRSLA